MAPKPKSKAKKAAGKTKPAAKKSAAAKRAAPKKLAAKTKKVAAKKKPAAKKAAAAKSRVAKPAARKKVSHIPKGYASITPYLIVGNASRAIEFYKNVFQAKLGMKMAKPDGKIGHAELKIGDSKIMLADEFPEMGARAPQAGSSGGMSLHFYTKNVDAVLKTAVSAGAKLLMPAQDMFYGDRVGTIEDPFGYKWHVSTHIEDVTPAQLRKRLSSMGKK